MKSETYPIWLSRMQFFHKTATDAISLIHWVTNETKDSGILRGRNSEDGCKVVL